MSIYCTNCNDPLREDDIRWAFESPYCDDCFDEAFRYCCRCDTLMYAQEANHNSAGDPFCAECWEEDWDEDCPDNPDVDEADRKMIIELSRNWLAGRQTRKSTLRINQNDHKLTRLKELVGLVENPLYVYGLQDREEYQLKASTDILELVSEFILLNDVPWTVITDIGTRRLGVCLSIRNDHMRDLIRLIKHTAKAQVLVPA